MTGERGKKKKKVDIWIRKQWKDLGGECLHLLTYTIKDSSDPDAQRPLRVYSPLADKIKLYKVLASNPTPSLKKGITHSLVSTYGIFSSSACEPRHKIIHHLHGNVLLQLPLQKESSNRLGKHLRKDTATIAQTQPLSLRLKEKILHTANLTLYLKYFICSDHLLVKL